jgi:hypothetical protein
MTPSDSPTNQFRAFAGLVGELSRTPGIHETGSESGQLGSGRCRARLLAVTTTEGAADFVAPSDRIAPFDQDGTTRVSHPLYGQALFARHGC